MLYSIYPLLNGTFTVRLGSNLPAVVTDVPSFAFLIVGDDNEALLVDTGFSQDFIPGIESTYTKEPGHELVTALDQLGYKTDDITTIIQTHLHWDHTGGMQLFKRAKYLVQAEEFRSLIDLGINEECSFCTDHWINLLARMVLKEGDSEIKPGLKLLLTGGHTRGHQAVAVQTATGLVILGGDIPFNYDFLWTSIPERIWQKYRLGHGKSFFWSEGVRSEISCWLREQDAIKSPLLHPWNLDRLKSISSRIYTSHDPRLIDIKRIS